MSQVTLTEADLAQYPGLAEALRKAEGQQDNTAPEEPERDKYAESWSSQPQYTPAEIQSLAEENGVTPDQYREALGKAYKGANVRGYPDLGKKEELLQKARDKNRRQQEKAEAATRQQEKTAAKTEVRPVKVIVSPNKGSGRVNMASKPSRGRTAPARGPSGVVRAPAPLHQATVFGESGKMRFLDAGITIGVAAGSVLWTATRPTEGQQLGWGAFWTLLGGLMAVQGSNELRYGGFGVCAANASYMTLRLLKPDLSST